MADSNIGTLWVKLGMKIDGLEKSLADVEKATTKIGKHLQSVGKQMAISGAAITASLGLMVKKTADFGDELNDLRQRTGIAADVLSSFKLVADKSGTSLAGVATGLKFLGRNMADAAAGGKDTADAFQSISVAVRNASGGLRPMDEVMMDVADRFAQMEDGAKKVDLAMRLFGKSGVELIPMLNLGRAGISELREEAKRLGIVISDEMASNADQFNDSMVSLKASLQGAGMTIARTLMPVLQSLAERVTDVVAGFREWADQNQGFVSSVASITAGSAGLLTVFGGLSIGVGSLMQKLPVLAAALGTTAGSLALLTAGISAGAAGILYYLSILDQVADAEEKLRAVETANAEVRGRITAQLMEAATRTAAMVAANRELAASEITTTAAMDAIIASFARFGDQAEVLAKKAILRGDFGPVLAEALRQVSAEAKTAGEQATQAATGMSALDAALLKLGIDVPKIKEELALAEQTLVALKASSDPLPGVIKALEDKIATLKAQLNGASDALDGFNGSLKTTTRLMETALPAAKNLGLAFQTVVAETPIPDAKSLPAWSTWGKAVGQTVTDVTHYFDGLYNDIAMGFAGAMEKLFDGTAKFKDFFVSIWDTIKKAFFRVIAEMVAKFLVDFVKNIVLGMNLIKAATSAWGGMLGGVGTAAAGVGVAGAGAAGVVGAGGAAAGVGIAASFGTAFTGAFLAVVIPGLLQGFGQLFGGWNKPKSAEQYQAERAWLATLTPRQQSQVNWWMEGSEPGRRGNIQMYFRGPVVQTTGLTQQDCYRASEYIFNAVESAERRRGR